MKKRYLAWFILAIIALALTACQRNQPVDEMSADRSIEGQLENRTAYPVSPGDESYPIQDDPLPRLDAAYPITEEDLQFLIRTWSLMMYTEDDIVQDPEPKGLIFKADGSYAITDDSGATSGNWNVRLSGIESTLVLEPDTGEPQAFEIVNLDEVQLKLRSMQGDVQINEQYVATD